MTILFLITARGGSKGIPRKNLALIGGRTLIGWKAIPARQIAAEMPGSRVIISTDSFDMAEEAKHHGVDVPFLRPARYATDDATTEDVIRHTMDWVETNTSDRYTDIMLLEPSSPFATVQHMREAITLKARTRGDLVCGMRESRPNQVFVGECRADHSLAPIITRMRYAGRRRQDHGPQWTMNGAVYLFSWEMFRKTGDRYGSENAAGLMMDDWHSLDIDTPNDLELARYAVQAGHVMVPVKM